MKTTLAIVLLALALSLCNLMGRRGNNNANSNAAPGEMAESSPAPTPGEVTSAPSSDRRIDAGQPPGPISVGRGTNSNTGVPQIADAPPPPPPPKPTPRAPISGGVLNGKATRLVQPAYPAIARAAHASGQVRVQVLVDENGNVVSATPVSGHPLLQSSAVAAARQSKFSPTMLSGQPVKVTGVIIYNFVAQ